jgi:hypothetical protein
VGNNQLPDDDPVRFLQKYFGNKDAGGSNKKSGASGMKVHPNYLMNKLDKQFKKDQSMDDYLNNSSPMGGVAAYNYINMNSDT